jgi:CheY-like chemotaxis protein
MRDVIAGMLSGFGCKAETLSALQTDASPLPIAMLAQDHALLILDNSFPGLDLPGFLAECAARKPGGPATPVIILTPLDTDPALEGILPCPEITFLSKPIKQSYLYQAVAACIGTSVVTPASPLSLRAKNDRNQFKTLAGKQVLVAEDEPVNQMVTSQLLTRVGILVDIAGNGQEALKALQSKTYDAVLMDVMMPEMDGLAATRAIRQTLRLDLPIIALTANAIKGDREKCLNAGMNEYLTKPVEIERLYQTLERFIAMQQP